MTSSTLHPASGVQRQFWLLQRLDPATRAYHVGTVLRVKGALDLAALRGAFEDLAARHAALRTTFEEREGELLQRVHEALPFPFEVVASRAPGDDVAAEVGRAFDLEHGPLLRVRVLEVAPQEAVIVWTMHHAITDLASKTLLAGELSARYAARRSGAAAALPAVSVEARPAAAAEAERAWLAGEAAARAEEWFASVLRSPPPPLALPLDRPRPAVQSSRGACVPVELGPELAAALEAAPARWQTRPFLVLFAAWAVLLSRLSGEEGVTVGVPFTNRRREASQGTVGAFVNTLPVPVDLSADPTFTGLLAALRPVFLGHHRHQELPLERIVARCRPPRDASRNPLFQAGFTFEPPMQVQLEGAEVRGEKAHAGGAQLDAFLTLWKEGGRYLGTLEYCADLFDAATAARWVRCYRALLTSLLAPGAAEVEPLSAAGLLDAAERETVVERFNATDVTCPGPERLDAWLVAQAERTPAAPALSMSGRTVSYGEHLARVRALAAELAAAGVGPGERVGVFMERSFELVTAIHAIVLAGGAYVPLEPEYPAQRLAFMVEDAAPRLVLTTAALAARCPQGAPVRVVDVEALAARAAPAARCQTGAGDPRDPAYVIFTSGSTGRPKGCVNTHRGIVNRLRWMQDAFALGPDDVVLHKTPFGFDVSVWELFWPFCVGARLEVGPPGVHRDPGALAALIQQAGVTTVHFVPSMLQVFLEHPAAAACRGLRRVVASGEALAGDLVRRFAGLLPAELDNLYGPTEAAVDVTWWRCRDDLAREPVPIGRPIANTRLYVLDRRGRPVPVGAPGELHIGGVQVALGYVNRPELTRERFVPDPFSPDLEARLYRTGDRARWNADGTIVFLGRLDHQVKIHGLRIELPEIEAVLDAHPRVRQSVVTARATAAGDTRLVAYVLADGADADAELEAALRAFAGERLPAFMVPAQVVRLVALPLTASGKVDRKALPEPPAAPPREAAAAPGTELERWLVEELAGLLGGARVGARENLFDAGATSLTAAQLVGVVRRRFGADLPLVRIFEHPTVAALATHLAATFGAGAAGAAGAHAAEPAAATPDPLAAARARAERRRSGRPPRG